MTPQIMEISPRIMKELRELEVKKSAINQMVQMVVSEGERRIATYNTQGRELWLQISEDLGIDIEKVMWVPHPTENKIVPIQVKINESTFSGDPGKVS